MNDGARCRAGSGAGRWPTTTTKEVARSTGWDDGQAELMLDGLTISNGLGWSPDGGTMYLVDSGPRVIHAFAFDADHGTGRNDGERRRRPLGGDLRWRAGQPLRTRRLAARGVPHPGPAVHLLRVRRAGLRQLLVTTATEGWTGEQRRAEPAAGLVYRFGTDATRPAMPFRPDLPGGRGDR